MGTHGIPFSSVKNPLNLIYNIMQLHVVNNFIIAQMIIISNDDDGDDVDEEDDDNLNCCLLSR